KFIKESSVKITPNASQVAKVLARGGAGYALSVAVEQLLGSVDWVLDPENNRIKYYVPVEGQTEKYYLVDGSSIQYTTLNDACTAIAKSMNHLDFDYRCEETNGYINYFMGGSF